MINPKKGKGMCSDMFQIEIYGIQKRCSSGRKFVMRIIFHPKKFTFYRSFKHHHQSISFLKALVSPSIDQRKFIKSLKNLNKHSKTEGVFPPHC